MRIAIALLAFLFLSGCASVQKKFDAARFHQRQMRLMRDASDLVNENLTEDCKYISAQECSELLRDQVILLQMFHEVGRYFNDETY